MRYRFLLTALLIIWAGAAFSQSDLDPKITELPSAVNPHTGGELKTTSFVFPDMITSYTINPQNGRALLCFEGEIPQGKNGKRVKKYYSKGVFDLRGKKFMWTLPVVDLSQSARMFGSSIYDMGDGRIDRLSDSDVDVMWSVKYDIGYIDGDKELLLGYKGANARSMTRVDNATGEPMWKREIAIGDGWQGTYPIDDTTLVVIADGIHSVNTATGKGWSYEMDIASRDWGKFAAVAGFGVALGVLTGVAVVPTEAELVTGLHSNVLVDGEDIYFSGKDRIVRLDRRTGAQKWVRKFEKNTLTKAIILKDDSLLHIINSGYVECGGRTIKGGVPFYGVFRKSDGSEVKTVALDYDGVLAPRFATDSTSVNFIYKDRILKYRMSDASLVAEKSFDIAANGELIDDGKMFFAKDAQGRYVKLSDLYPSNVVVTCMSPGGALVLDSKLEIVATIASEDVFAHEGSVGECHLLRDTDGAARVVDKNGSLIDKFNIPSDAVILDNYIYYVRGGELVEMDFSGYFDRKQ